MNSSMSEDMERQKRLTSKHPLILIIDIEHLIEHVVLKREDPLQRNWTLLLDQRFTWGRKLEVLAYHSKISQNMEISVPIFVRCWLLTKEDALLRQTLVKQSQG